MSKPDYFLNYTKEDLNYELDMLVKCRCGINTFSDPFLYNLCIEGWLLHARRIMEVFHLVKDEKWHRRHGDISNRHAINILQWFIGKERR